MMLSTLAILPARVAQRPPIRAQAANFGGSWGGPYDAVQASPARTYRPHFATDSKHSLTSWSRLRALSLSRWAYINVPVVKAATDLMARLTVGTGFAPVTPGPLGKLYDSIYEQRARNIGFMGGESMDELLLHDCRASDVDGDLGYILTADEFGSEKIQLIEGHRITSGRETDPHCIDGVWIDRFGRRTAYNVAIPGDEILTKQISAQDFIYMAERNRPDELRSMTAFIHALNPLQDLYEIMAFAMTSAKRNAEIAAVLETSTPNDTPFSPRGILVQPAAVAVGDGTEVGDSPAAPAQYVTYDQIIAGGGKIPVLKPGEKLQSHVHNHVPPEIEQWSEFIIRGIAAGYGVPFEILWNPESIGGANTRMVTALLRTRLMQRRAGLIFPKLNRVRFWLLSRSIKRGEIPFDPAIFKCEWQPKFTDITVDAGRESRERRANVLAGCDTFTSYDAENGNDYLGHSLPTREKEIDAQCAAAQRLVEKYPQMTFATALARIALLTAGASEVSAAAVSGTGAADSNNTP